MKHATKANLLIATGVFLAFILWTITITKIDVQPIGPNNTVVGLATLNDAFHTLTGVHWLLYEVTDWMSIAAILIAFGFAVLGLCQMIYRKSITRVDTDILILGLFYVAVILGYIVFEMLVINYRPVLVDGNLEASYPSSTTLLMLTIMPTAIMQAKERISCHKLRAAVIIIMIGFTLLMVAARTISGVHWLTDIVGGVLLSISLVMFYQAAINATER